jgi:hypothetical protein
LTVADSKFFKFMRELLNITEYESEATKFMRDFMAQHPEELESQKKGRGAWWDKDPKERTAPPGPRHSPKSGGAEYTFRA